MRHRFKWIPKKWWNTNLNQEENKENSTKASLATLRKEICDGFPCFYLDPWLVFHVGWKGLNKTCRRHRDPPNPRTYAVTESVLVMGIAAGKSLSTFIKEDHSREKRCSVDGWWMVWMGVTHRIHGTGIFTYIWVMAVFCFRGRDIFGRVQ